MPESPAGDKNTIGLTRLFSLLGLRKTSAILRLTPRWAAHISAAPTANGVYRKTSRVLAAKGFATQMVPLAPASGSRPPGRVFYASSVRKGIRRRRRTSALAFGSAADVFVVASSKLGPVDSFRGAGQSNLVTGSQSAPASLRRGREHVKLESLILAQNERWRQA